MSMFNGWLNNRKEPVLGGGGEWRVDGKCQFVELPR